MTGALELTYGVALNDVIGSSGPPPTGSLLVNTLTLNANGSQRQYNFQCPKDGSITKVYYKIESITGSPGRLLFQLNSLLVTGVGQNAQLNSTNDFFNGPHTVGINSFTLTTPVSVTRGQWIGYNVRASTASGSWSSGGTGNNMALATSYNASTPFQTFGSSAPYGSSGSSKVTYAGFMAVEYSDGTVVGGFIDTRDAEITSSPTNKAYGNCFTIPPEWGSAKVVGMKITMSNEGLGSTDLKFRLHSVSGTTATTLTTDTEDGDFRRVTNDATLSIHYFATPQTINGGDKVIASIETTSTTLRIPRFNFTSSTYRSFWNNLTDIEACNVDLSTNTITFYDRLYGISLLVTDIVKKSGGGGGFGAKFGGGLANV